MKRFTIATMLVGAALGLAFSGAARAEARSEMGKQEYNSNCVACHGAGGKGDGYFAQYLKLPVPDLTTIQARNKGVFPTDRVIEIIDGRQALTGHGPRNMPIWGTTYTEKAANYYRGNAYDAEQFIRVRVLALTDYLYTLQVAK
ncbi:MAG TPA: c-type cytochrome [Burkholderiaceae bacterium]|nr:c-type cytochrome [Burkholderiaceae bacterium]HQR70390.1 c-type cytochrome [Burkholderiaceae bacterium]